MIDLRKAAEQALEALEDLTNGHESDPALFKDEIAAAAALRAALDAQERDDKAQAMTTGDALRMAREAGYAAGAAAAVGVAAERERMTANSIHTCHPECDKPGCVAVREAVKAEREACAKVCGDLADATKNHEYYSAYVRCEATIRARGET